MATIKRLTDLQIKSQLRSRRLHHVATDADRRRVLNIARIDEIDLTTREHVEGGFLIFYLPQTK